MTEEDIEEAQNYIEYLKEKRRQRLKKKDK